MSLHQTWGNHFGEHKVRDVELIRFQEPPRAEYVEYAKCEDVFNVRNNVAYPVDFGPSSLRTGRTFEYRAPMAVPLQSGYRPFYLDAPGHASVSEKQYIQRTSF